jgi:hypothetical protein
MRARHTFSVQCAPFKKERLTAVIAHRDVVLEAPRATVLRDLSDGATRTAGAVPARAAVVPLHCETAAVAARNPQACARIAAATVSAAAASATNPAAATDPTDVLHCPQ